MLQTEREKVAHLLRRFAFGASEAEVAYYSKDGLSGAIDKLLNYSQVDEGFSLSPQTLQTGKNGQKLTAQALQQWWLLRMMCTRRPLQEKMTLFWHDHFATSNEKVSSTYMMFAQNNILRENATSKFRDLLTRVSKDPAMLLWLDNQFNVKGKPNENFAREVMELFTLGIGNYSEKDVQEGARAFTGWAFGAAGARRQPKAAQKLGKNQVFKDVTAEHDEGVKKFLGKEGNFDGDDIITILCNQPQCARYLTKKIWEWFAYANPSEALVNRLAEQFHQSGLDIAVLLRAIMNAPEFYSDLAYRTIYKNPVDFTVSTLRQLGFGADPITDENYTRDMRPAIAARISTTGMGMTLFYPPDVSGWDGGAQWVSSATMVERLKWGQILFDQATVALKTRSFTVGSNAWNLFANASSPESAVDRLLSIFDVQFSPEKKAKLLATARSSSGGAITQANANDVAASLTQLIFTSPEFQFA